MCECLYSSSLAEEAEVKTRKLKKLWSKYEGARKEVVEVQEDFQVTPTYTYMQLVYYTFYKMLALSALLHSGTSDTRHIKVYTISCV